MSQLRRKREVIEPHINVARNTKTKITNDNPKRSVARPEKEEIKASVQKIFVRSVSLLRPTLASNIIETSGKTLKDKLLLQEELILRSKMFYILNLI